MFKRILYKFKIKIYKKLNFNKYNWYKKKFNNKSSFFLSKKKEYLLDSTKLKVWSRIRKRLPYIIRHIETYILSQKKKLFKNKFLIYNKNKIKVINKKKHLELKLKKIKLKKKYFFLKKKMNKLEKKIFGKTE